MIFTGPEHCRNGNIKSVEVSTEGEIFITIYFDMNEIERG